MFKLLHKIQYTISNIQSINSGFTLIELLVVFTLASIVSGIGFASFASYSRRQVVIQAAANFKQTVDLARFNALSSVKPTTVCGETDELSNFKVVIINNVDYEMSVTCGIEHVQVAKTLPQNVTFSNVPG